MKGLTLWQPWASLVTLPEGQGKKIETRSWGTSYRGLVAIHAASGPMNAECKEACMENPYIFDALWNRLNVPPSIAAKQMPRGVIVAVAEITGCYEMLDVLESQIGSTTVVFELEGETEGVDGPDTFRECIDDREIHFGNYAVGRFAWMLDNIAPLPEPVPCKGGQRLWNVPAAVLAQIEVACPEIKEKIRAQTA